MILGILVAFLFLVGVGVIACIKRKTLSFLFTNKKSTIEKLRYRISPFLCIECSICYMALRLAPNNSLLLSPAPRGTLTTINSSYYWGLIDQEILSFAFFL